MATQVQSQTPSQNVSHASLHVPYRNRGWNGSVAPRDRIPLGSIDWNQGIGMTGYGDRGGQDREFNTFEKSCPKFKDGVQTTQD